MAKLLKKHFTGKDIFMQYCYLSQEKNWTNMKMIGLMSKKKTPNLEKDTFWLQ